MFGVIRRSGHPPKWASAEAGGRCSVPPELVTWPPQQMLPGVSAEAGSATKMKEVGVWYSGRPITPLRGQSHAVSVALRAGRNPGPEDLPPELVTWPLSRCFRGYPPKRAPPRREVWSWVLGVLASAGAGIRRSGHPPKREVGVREGMANHIPARWVANHTRAACVASHTQEFLDGQSHPGP